MVLQVPVESDSLVVQFFGTEKKGITRLNDGRPHISVQNF